MGLSAEEKKQLKALERKAQEPDPPAMGKSVSVHVDLSDANSVAMAKKYGFLPSDEPENDDEDTDEDEEDDEETPRRKGYFKDT